MDLSHTFVDTITVKSQTGSNAGGNPTFAIATTFKAKVASSQKKILNAQGSVVQASHQLLTDQSLSINARVWLPGDDTNDERVARRVLQVESESLPDNSYRLTRAYIG